MKTRFQYILSACALAGGLFLSESNVLARPDYTRRTKQECAYCHPAGGWYLNDAGKFFRDHRNLEGYKPPAEPPKTSNQDHSNQKSTAQNGEKAKSPGK